MSREVAPASIPQRIMLIRGQKVMLDSDLAELYGVPTKAFNQAIKRNLLRFPADFMIQVSEEEAEILRSQFVTSSSLPRSSASVRECRHFAIDAPQALQVAPQLVDYVQPLMRSSALAV